jgi:hypothetical protein
MMDDSAVIVPKEVEEANRFIQQNYVLTSQYESLESDDLYTKYKVRSSTDKGMSNSLLSII